MWKIRNCAETCGRSFCLQVVPVDWFFFLFDYKVFFTISKYAYNNRGWIRIRNSLNSGFTTLINSLNWLMLLSGKSVGRVFLEQTSLISVQKVSPPPPCLEIWPYGNSGKVKSGKFILAAAASVYKTLIHFYIQFHVEIGGILSSFIGNWLNLYPILMEID